MSVHPDAVFFGGQIATLDRGQPEAEALSGTDGKISQVKHQKLETVG